MNMTSMTYVMVMRRCVRYGMNVLCKSNTRCNADQCTASQDTKKLFHHARQICIALSILAKYACILDCARILANLSREVSLFATPLAQFLGVNRIVGKNPHGLTAIQFVSANLDFLVVVFQGTYELWVRESTEDWPYRSFNRFLTFPSNSFNRMDGFSD